MAKQYYSQQTVPVLLLAVLVLRVSMASQVSAQSWPAPAPYMRGWSPSFAPGYAPEYAPSYAPAWAPEYAPAGTPEGAPASAPVVASPAYAPSSGPSWDYAPGPSPASGL